MKSKLLALAASFVLMSLPLHSSDEKLQPIDELQTKFELGQGYRQDHLKWSKSGDHKKPNILSELDFKNIQIYMSTIRGMVSNGIYKGELSLGYGNVIKGKCQDSDYFKDNRRGEFSRSISRISGSYNVDSSVKIGRIFTNNRGTFLTTSLGYAMYVQKYAIQDGYQTLFGKKTFHKNEHKIHDLKSSYKASWSAPFIDFLLTVPIFQKVNIDFGYTFFYPVAYSGHGYWNLRKRPGPNFKQKARASKSFGQKGEIGLRYNVTSRFELGFKLGTMHFVAHDGSDKWTHWTKLPFRKAQRTSIDYMLTASYSF
jgi:hypothetical protein